MTKDEALAMDLALEALEHMLEDAKQERLTVEYWNECVDAITAIKQARALDKKAENARELGLDYEPAPVHEPVAWMQDDGCHFSIWKDKYSTIPLYTTPPTAQRQWVGLTDEQKCELVEMTDSDPQPHHLRELIDVTEAKLKEKNA